MPNFDLTTSLAPSKSIHNRALLLQEQCGQDQAMQLASDSRDVKEFKQILMALRQGETDLWVGEGGAVLRFLVPYLLLQGQNAYRLRLAPSLAARPQQTLQELARQCQGDLQFIDAQNWRLQPGRVRPRRFVVGMQQSSQFVSGLLLALANSRQTYQIELSQKRLSESYLQMTLKMLAAHSVQYQHTPTCIEVDYQEFGPASSSYWEPDMSSAFSLAAIAAVCGRLHLQAYDFRYSMQGDFVFLQILDKMGARISLTEQHELVVEKATSLGGIDWNLANCPDLFPVLSALCFLSKQRSRLYGAEHLAVKESSRIESMAEIFAQTKRPILAHQDGMEFPAHDTDLDFTQPLQVDSHGDHRIVFAAEVLRAAGFSVTVKGEAAVEKSFASYFEKLRAGGLL